MGHTGRYLHLAFLMSTAFSLPPGTEANSLYLWTNKYVNSDSVIQNNTGRYQNENAHTNPATPEVAYKVNPTNTPEIVTSSHTVSLTPKSEREFYSPSVVGYSSPTAESIENTSKSHGDVFKKDACEENNKNMAVLICLIIIAVLFLVCTLLFLSTVVLANKVSSLRRSKQAGKRQPRTNGDFLASSGLWPADSDTWKRAKQLTGPNLMMQSAGVLTAARQRKDEGGTETLTN